MLSILRMATALIFMLHGTTKLFGYPPTDQPRPELLSLIGVAGVLEVIGGLLLILGLFTRPVALVLAIEMMVAYGMMHLPRGIFPTLNGGEPAYLFGVVFLYLAVAGGGAWSLDRALGTVGESVTVPG
ncbi:MAG: DoxX family protein [Gemmatimonadales bacterium]